jgi:hypothetical protein
MRSTSPRAKEEVHEVDRRSDDEGSDPQTFADGEWGFGKGAGAM